MRNFMLYKSDAFEREWKESFDGLEINEEILSKIFEKAMLNPSLLRQVYDQVFILYYSSNNDLNSSIDIVLNELVKKEYEFNKTVREYLRSL